MDAQPREAEVLEVQAGNVSADATRRQERWRLSSACSGGFYDADWRTDLAFPKLVALDCIGPVESKFEPSGVDPVVRHAHAVRNNAATASRPQERDHFGPAHADKIVLAYKAVAHCPPGTARAELVGLKPLPTLLIERLGKEVVAEVGAVHEHRDAPEVQKHQRHGDPSATGDERFRLGSQGECKSAVEQRAAQPRGAQGRMVARSYGGAEARTSSERWRPTSACSGGFYGTYSDALANASRTPSAMSAAPVTRSTQCETAKNRRRTAPCDSTTATSPNHANSNPTMVPP